MEIRQHPPKLFYNAMGGKRHGFVVRVSAPAHRQLAATLVYAGDLSPVAGPKDLFRVLEIRAEGAGLHSFKVRINQVSRKHSNRAFRIKFQAPGGVASVYTSPVVVRSKIVAKRPRPESPSCSSSRHHCSSKKRHCPSVSKAEWASLATDVLASLEWRVIGFELKLGGACARESDPARPIVQCPLCHKTCGFGARREHAPACSFRRLLGRPAPAGAGASRPEKEILGESSGHFKGGLPPVSPDSVMDLVLLPAAAPAKPLFEKPSFAKPFEEPFEKSCAYDVAIGEGDFEAALAELGPMDLFAEGSGGGVVAADNWEECDVLKVFSGLDA